MNKSKIRKIMLEKRSNQNAEHSINYSNKICNKLLSISELKEKKIIASYSAINGEVNPQYFTDKVLDSKNITLPYIDDDKKMSFRIWNKNIPLIKGKYNIPCPPESAKPVIPDIILLPLLAFDNRGSRLGYGGGFYDKYINNLQQNGHNPLLIGLAYSWQQQESLPNEPHDVKLHIIITEKEKLLPVQ